MQVVLTRDNISIPWGFRLKGGAEYNVPLSILKVNEGSPSHYRLDVGDELLNIGNYSAINLKHEEALNIIRMFDYSLPLLIQKHSQQSQQMQYSPGTSFSPTRAPAAKPVSNVWRPPSVSGGFNDPYASQTTPSAYGGSSTYAQTPSYNQGFMSPSAHFTSPSPGITSFGGDIDSHRPISPSSSNLFQYPGQQNYGQSSGSAYQSSIPYHSAQSPSSHYQPTAAAASPYTVSSPPFSPVSPNRLTNTHAHPHYSSPSPAPISPVSHNAPPPPPAPPMPASFETVNNYRANKVSASSSADVTSSNTYNKSTVSSSGGVPDALLKAMNSSVGKKPFTYTPGGIDLSRIRDSARVKRYDSLSSADFHSRQQQQQQQYYQSSSSSFAQNQESYHRQSTSQSDLNFAASNNNYNSPQQQSAGAAHTGQNNFVSNTSFRLNSASSNNFSSPSSAAFDSQSFISRASPHRAMPSNSRGVGPFGITPDQLVRPPRPKDDAKDMMNQSFSFKMLNKWISDSEATGAPLFKSKQDEEEEKQKAAAQAVRKSEVIKAIEEEEMKKTSYQQHQQYNSIRNQSPRPKIFSVNQNRAAVPSKVFQYVDRKFSDSDSSVGGPGARRDSVTEDPMLSYNSVPARDRMHEQEAPRYKGASIPSKTFKFLQYLTQNDDSTTSNTATSSNMGDISMHPAPQIQSMQSNKQQQSFHNVGGEDMQFAENSVYGFDQINAQSQSQSSQALSHQPQSFASPAETHRVSGGGVSALASNFTSASQKRKTSFSSTHVASSSSSVAAASSSNNSFSFANPAYANTSSSFASPPPAQDVMSSFESKETVIQSSTTSVVDENGQVTSNSSSSKSESKTESVTKAAEITPSIELSVLGDDASASQTTAEATALITTNLEEATGIESTSNLADASLALSSDSTIIETSSSIPPTSTATTIPCESEISPPEPAASDVNNPVETVSTTTTTISSSNLNQTITTSAGGETLITEVKSKIDESAEFKNGETQQHHLEQVETFNQTKIDENGEQSQEGHQTVQEQHYVNPDLLQNAVTDQPDESAKQIESSQNVEESSAPAIEQVAANDAQNVEISEF